MKKPNFFILGAPKCGTTSMAAWLGEHPRIYTSAIKEPFFFSTDIRNQLVRTRPTYLRLFSGVRKEHLAVGEASATYLFSQAAVPSIEEHLPGARYTVMLRNPVELGYALHDQRIREFNENVKDFRRAWHLA